ncbi:hypothetical protein EJ05DRAFT_200001 [Pseudovirgaria hyperparasitica]|uniref:Prion-inhibition and propagation HeLo domain-containing protein n=1 Tax=Pseudovirgaria hyperparasitica TaxID=470096 RepID=A0A6A6WJ75_9PEZI|nr:uncharacterized protein EJ05DRAFT_200001 [Pseudovirgaria hyperparasitica]KAF2762190.1 hypothetical protein EJ05DRAFT_200001 [Pseudovirgaria hyperparasitica]
MTDHQHAMSIEEQADILERVTSLATTFSTCVEAFGLVHPVRQSDRPQKLAITRLGIEQSRLLIFGDAVGISSPPRSIATHMIPSRPGALNPDPNEPVNFGERDARLDDPEIRQQVENTLNEILERPVSLSREDMMQQYGMTSPKKPVPFEPPLDTTRIEAFREKFGLLHDLVGQYIVARRGQSMTTQHWYVNDVAKFESFVQMVRSQVNKLIALFNVEECVDRGMSIDIKALGWHPDISGPVVRRDWEKLRLIAEACKDDYPQYVKATATALEYLNRTWREANQVTPTLPRKSPTITITKEPPNGTEKKKPGRPGWLKSLLGKKNKSERATTTLSSSNDSEHGRSKSVDISPSEPFTLLERTRSKSLSATSTDKPLPNPHTVEHTYLSSDASTSEIANPGAASIAALSTQETSSPLSTQEQQQQQQQLPSPPSPKPIHTPTNTFTKIDSPQASTSPDGVFPALLAKVDTYNSMIERHDQYAGIGRVETKDQRHIAHGWHN